MSHPRRIAVLAGLGLLLAPAASAQKPTKPPKPPKGAYAVSLDARPNPVVHGSPTTLSGRLTGETVAGVRIRLEEDTTLPLGDAYTFNGMTATTAPSGAYSFTAKPLVNTQYRVVAQSSPPVTSAPRLVSVRMLVGLRVSDSTPRAGTRIRFSGSVFPAHDGRRALIQRRSSTGRFVTVARTTLRDAGDERSSYRRRLRIRRDGVYRVKVRGDADHVNGFSRKRKVDVR